jgi:D-alanyl-lipoteichoic acid acyltransferase DltB (MBOAT superfamily)
MLFNSYAFAAFFAVLFPLYWSLRNRLALQNALLLAAAYFFYGCWDYRFLGLLALSTVMDFGCGLLVDRYQTPWKRKFCVIGSMALNLGMLGYFKYCNFFVDSLVSLLSRAGLEVGPIWLEVALPIGISFYTFQSMAYVIDVYRGDIRPTRNLLEFATFVSFFPHLVAGPIMRPTSLLPQVSNPRVLTSDRLYSGSYLILWGLTKKVVVADNLALIADDLFGRWQTIDGGLALLAIYAFAFQIYCDFSGYTDVARGVARLLGFELALNFNLPYFAKNPREFWQRWHISLSEWLRDYLYIPLGGNRGGRLMIYRNLMLTMALGGLWHGASWTFVAWGVYQGLLLICHRLLGPWLAMVRPVDPVERAWWGAVRVFAMFHLTCLGWLLFRAESIEQAAGMLAAIGRGLSLPPLAYLGPVVVLVVPLLAVQAAQLASGDLEVVKRLPWYARSAFYTACFYAFVLGGEFDGKQFLYFQF